MIFLMIVFMFILMMKDSVVFERFIKRVFCFFKDKRILHRLNRAIREFKKD